MVEWKDRKIYGSMDGLTNGWKDGRMDGRKVQTDVWKGRWTDLLQAAIHSSIHWDGVCAM